MKRTIRNQWKVALAAGVLTTLWMLPQARAELVYEPEISPNAPAQVREQDREETRQALAASVKAQDTLQAQQQASPVQYATQQPVQYVAQPPVQQPVQYVAQQPVQQQPIAQPPVQYVSQAPVAQYAAQPQAPAVIAPAQPVTVPVAVQVQPVAPLPQAQPAPQAQPVQGSAVQSADAQQPEVESLSKAELMRRERMRTELQNEDLLDERLEELRLRDEKRRTQELLGDPGAAQEQPISAIPGLAMQQPQSQVVVSPVTDHPGEPAPQVAPLPGTQSAYTQAAQDQINMSQAQATTTASGASVLPEDQNKPSQFYISPRFGISSMNVNSSLTGVSASGLYSLGIALGTEVSDNVGFEIGYMNAQYGISLGQAYMVPGLQQYSYQLSQNVIDAMLKLYFLGPDSRIRPYIGAGGGYSMSSLNYPSQLASMYSYLNNQSYNSNAFLGELAAGADVKISKQISVGAMFKYSDVFSSTQNNNLQYYGGGYGYSGAYGGGYPYAAGTNAQQALTGASLSQASFYSVTGTLNFSF